MLYSYRYQRHCTQMSKAELRHILSQDRPVRSLSLDSSRNNSKGVKRNLCLEKLYRVAGVIVGKTSSLSENL